MEALEFAQEELAPRGEENVNTNDPIFQSNMHQICVTNFFFFFFALPSLIFWRSYLSLIP